MSDLRPLALLLLTLGCASGADRASPAPLRVAPHERVGVDQVVVLIDGSLSLPAAELSRARSILDDFVDRMPAGGYESALVAFGGKQRVVDPLARFDRGRVRRFAAQLSVLGVGSPLHQALDDARRALRGRGYQASIVLLSAGVPGEEVGPNGLPALEALAAASLLAAEYVGAVCFHTLQVGGSVEGSELLRALAETTECGSYRPAHALATTAHFEQLVRDVFVSLPAGGSGAVGERAPAEPSSPFLADQAPARAAQP